MLIEFDRKRPRCGRGFRARAYRRAADVVSRLERPVGEILAKEGRDGLVAALPAIETGITGAIAEMVATGRWSHPFDFRLPSTRSLFGH